jgi:hypothetical protein
LSVTFFFHTHAHTHTQAHTSTQRDRVTGHLSIPKICRSYVVCVCVCVCNLI